jgi:hypothetical protein
MVSTTDAGGVRQVTHGLSEIAATVDRINDGRPEGRIRLVRESRGADGGGSS